MGKITRWKVSGPATRLQPDADGPWVALVDYYHVIVRLIAERDEARADVKQLIVERDSALAEVKRLTAERDLALAEVKRSKDWLEVAAQVADLVGAKARTDDGKETADKIARRIRALMEGTR